MGPMIRAASLRGFAVLVDELGGDPDRLLDRFGMSQQMIADDEALIPITAHDLMLDAAAAELDCPDFGRRLAVRQDLTILGPLALAIQASSTVDDALGCASRFLFVHSPALSVAVEADPYGQRGIVSLTYRKDLCESVYSQQGIELGVGLFFRIAELLVGGRIGLRSVEFPHGPLSPVDDYVEFFGCDVRFERPAAALRVERRVLEARFEDANETIRQIAVRFLTENYSDPHRQTRGRVRRVVAERLATTPSLADVARLFAVHPRTLQRRLAAEDTTFEALLDDVRRDAAYRLITTGDLPLVQVAELVGFTEQSTLTHAVRRWYGVSPRRLRASTTTELSR